MFGCRYRERERVRKGGSEREKGSERKEKGRERHAYEKGERDRVELSRSKREIKRVQK